MNISMSPAILALTEPGPTVALQRHAAATAKTQRGPVWEPNVASFDSLLRQAVPVSLNPLLQGEIEQSAPASGIEQAQESMQVQVHIESDLDTRSYEYPPLIPTPLVQPKADSQPTLINLLADSPENELPERASLAALESAQVTSPVWGERAPRIAGLGPALISTARLEGQTEVADTQPASEPMGSADIHTTVIPLEAPQMPGRQVRQALAALGAERRPEVAPVTPRDAVPGSGAPTQPVEGSDTLSTPTTPRVTHTRHADSDTASTMDPGSLVSAASLVWPAEGLPADAPLATGRRQDDTLVSDGPVPGLIDSAVPPTPLASSLPSPAGALPPVLQPGPRAAPAPATERLSAPIPEGNSRVRSTDTRSNNTRTAEVAGTRHAVTNNALARLDEGLPADAQLTAGRRQNDTISSGNPLQSPTSNAASHNQLASPATTSAGAPSIAQALTTSAPVLLTQRFAAPIPEGFVPVRVDTPIKDEAFPRVLGIQIGQWINDEVQQVWLDVHPADMGPVAIQISVDGRQTELNFGVESATARQVIEASLPALASALQSAGLTLSGGSISQDMPQPRSGADQDDQRGSAAATRQTGQGQAGAADFPIGVKQAPSARGLLDLYA